MEKQSNPFDKSLRDFMKGHRLDPPEEARKAFLEEAPAHVAPGKNWFRWYYIPVLIVFIAGTIMLVSYYLIPVIDRQYTAEPETVVSKIDATVPDSSGISNPSTSSLISSNTSNTTDVSTSIANNYKSDKSDIVITGTAKRAENPESTKAVKNILPTTGSNTKEEVIDGNMINVTVSGGESGAEMQNPFVKENDILPVSDDPVLQDKNTDLVLVGNDVQADTGNMASGKDTVGMLPVSSAGNNDGNPPSGISFFSAGICYQPEWMFNTTEDRKFINNFGVEATYHREEFSITTGVGLSISEGRIENAVGYNEFLGTYNKLDSVTFSFDEQSHNFAPELHMSSQNVWDSIVQVDSTGIRNRYTYLQVPVILGFDFWHKGRFSAGVRIGTIMSVMLNSKQISGNYDAGQNQVVGTQRISPDQVHLNWQAIGGFNAAAMLTKNIILEIEPQARYYYGSIYGKSGYNNKPWSVGFKTGLKYKF